VTVDVVIAGRGGFIGGLLTSMLADHGVDAVDVRDFATGSGRAKLLVNLANIPGDPAANLSLLNERIDLIGSRVDHWLEAQSFITLYGRGGLDLSRFNAGFTPIGLDHYAAGKLIDERRLMNAAAAREIGGLTLAYLPAVLDEGGTWARVRAQADRNGYVLPPRMSAAARANFVYVTDLAAVVLAWHRRSDLPAVTRLIVNDPLSRTTTWPELLGPTRQLSPNYAGRPAALKRAARNARATASVWRWGTAASLGRLGVPVGEPAPTDAREPVEPREPVEFTGVMRLLARHQGFLPPTLYASPLA
jgi:hypothetical protein